MATMTLPELQAPAAALTAEKELLRFSTAGSVDDGKSTLIGRLLYDSKGAYEDQIASARKATSNVSAGPLDFSLLTDGLRSEREQGITIDVAYRYFSTPRRKFIIADTPGHEQYTRNMATGASTAHLAIILIDARNGVLPQSRRHAYIAALLGIRHIVVAINKMDLMEFRRDVFDELRDEFSRFAERLEIPDLTFIPISALQGDNVVRPSGAMPWYDGPTLLEHLEGVEIASDRDFRRLRFPVQYVLRPNLDFRGYAGTLAAGVARPGDGVVALPSGRKSRIASISTYDGDLKQAFPPMSVALCLEDEIDLGRGDMLVSAAAPPHVSRRIEATLVWMNATALEPGRQYLLKHTTQQTPAEVTAIQYRTNVNTQEQEPASELHLNEIGSVIIEAHRPLFFDPYRENRSTGAFILIDPISNATLAAGMIAGPAASSELTRVAAPERHARTGHRPAIVWLPAAEELAYVLERKLFDRGCQVAVLARQNPRALAEIAASLTRAGFIAICVPASAQARIRRQVEKTAGTEHFLSIGPKQLPASHDAAAEEICSRLLDSPRQ